MFKTLKAILIFIVTVMVSFVMLEVYLQSAEIQTPMETRIDPKIGPTFIPDKKVTRFNEGFYIGGINEYGYVGPAYPPHRQGETTRLLLMGDSYVMGMTVFARHHFARSLESELEQRSGRSVEALNFGKADFNLSNLYQYYTDFAGSFDHDYALFFVDEADLVPARQIDRDLYPFCYVEAGKIMVDYSFRENAKYQIYLRIEPISEHSAFFRLAFNARKMVARGELAKVVLDKFVALVPKKPRPKRAAHRELKIPNWTVPILEVIGNDPGNILVIKSELDPEVMKLVKQSGIRYIDLTGELARAKAAGNDPYYWRVTGERGHWNHAAHRLIGEYLAKEIESRFPLDSLRVTRSEKSAP